MLLAKVILKKMGHKIIQHFSQQTGINTAYVSSWKSKGLSAETIKPPATSDNSLTPALSYYGTKTRVKFNGSCLQQPKVSYTQNNSKHQHFMNWLLVVLTLMKQH